MHDLDPRYVEWADTALDEFSGLTFEQRKGRRDQLAERLQETVHAEVSDLRRAEAARVVRAMRDE